MLQHETWDRGIISTVMSGSLGSSDSPKALVEVPTCKSDTVRATSSRTSFKAVIMPGSRSIS